MDSLHRNKTLFSSQWSLLQPTSVDTPQLLSDQDMVAGVDTVDGVVMEDMEDGVDMEDMDTPHTAAGADMEDMEAGADMADTDGVDTVAGGKLLRQLFA